MNVGIDLAFLIPTDFWDYMWYTALFVVLAAIPAILSLRDYNETSVIQILFSITGLAGIIYSLIKAWLVAPGSWYYLVFAGISIVLAALAGINLFLKASSNGVSSYECFISLFGLIIFPIVAVISVLKAWFVIPSDGYYMDYLRFAVIWLVLVLVCAGSLAVLTFTHKNFKGDVLIFGGLGFFFFMEMIYSLQKTWDTMPDSTKLGIIIAVLLVLFLTGGGAASAGAYGHQSE
jgi:hypothetical protein